MTIKSGGLKWIPVKHIISTGDRRTYGEFINLYLTAFPPDERREEEQLVELINTNAGFSCFVLRDEAQFVGLFASWGLGDLVFIEHFAVKPELRNLKYGSKMLEQFLQDASGLVVLEVPKPPSSPDAPRRILFYERLGFVLNDNFDYIQPPYSSDKRPVGMYIMSYPRRLHLNEFGKFKKIVYREVYNVE